MKALLFVVLAVALSKQLYDPKKSYVTPVSELNFEKQINKIRQTTKFVTIVHFYKFNDGESKQFAPKYDEFTNEYKGIFRIASVDCDDAEKICQKEGVSKYPTLKVYPPYPMPAVDFEGQLDTAEITKFASRYIHNNAIEITEGNLGTFINENPSVPKVLLFVEKKGFPLVYKGLSVEFEKKLTFGVVRSSESALVDRYSIKTFPSMIVVKSSEKKPYIFKGEFKFKPMFEFLNVYSEVFVPGGGSSQDSNATKDWMTVLVPQLHQKSANDICLKVHSALCVILINKDDKPDNALIDEFKSLLKEYERQIDRGTVYKFMWLDASKEKNWAKQFNFEGEQKVILLNPGSTKKYTTHEGVISKDAIRKTLEKIAGGEARFKRLGDSLPEFSL